MVQINLERRELTIKIVYYGPALSGKTTNLESIYRLLAPEARGRLMVLDTADDRTLFFDLMPVFFTTQSGYRVKIKLFTVPGQVIHNSTRRIVLQGVDGIAFVADSQKRLIKENNDSWKDMIANLKLNGLKIDEIPTVIQFNKRDLPEIRSDEEIATVAKNGQEPVFKAVAIRNLGVMETFEGVLRAAWRSLDAKYGLGEKLNLKEDDFLSHITKFRSKKPPQDPLLLRKDPR